MHLNPGRCQTATVWCLRYHQGPDSAVWGHKWIDRAGLTHRFRPWTCSSYKANHASTQVSKSSTSRSAACFRHACGFSGSVHRNQSKHGERWRGPVVVLLCPPHPPSSWEGSAEHASCFSAAPCATFIQWGFDFTPGSSPAHINSLLLSATGNEIRPQINIWQHFADKIPYLCE